MKRTVGFLVMSMLVASILGAGQAIAQGNGIPGNPDALRKAEQSMAVILVGDGSGRVQSVSAGVLIRPDGILLTAYHPLKGAQEVQVRLRDGEVYDQVELVGLMSDATWRRCTLLPPAFPSSPLFRWKNR